MFWHTSMMMLYTSNGNDMADEIASALLGAWPSGHANPYSHAKSLAQMYTLIFFQTFLLFLESAARLKPNLEPCGLPELPQSFPFFASKSARAFAAT